ncbi:MAG: hypothetical protein ACKVZJ_06850 [Phycisphaerales bacterium]
MIDQHSAARAVFSRGVQAAVVVLALGNAPAHASTQCLPATPPSTIVEVEPNCGVPIDNYNGGCRSPSNAAVTVPANATITGTLFDNITTDFDTDTYEFDIAWPGGNVTVKAWAPYPVYAVIDDLNCSSPLLAVGLSEGCTPAQARIISLPPGKHRLMVTTSPVMLSCGGPYVASIQTCPCPGDFNGDCTVSTPDLIMLLGRFGNDDLPPYSVGDLNNDRQVDTADLVRFLARFGCAG